MVRFELGFDPVSGKRWISRKSVHTTCIRRIQQRRGGESQNKSPASDLPPASYSYKSLSLGETEYPFPSGLYMARLISLIQKSPLPQNDPILQLLSNNYLPAPSSQNPKKARPTSTFGNKYAKEITESMAMVDAVERAMKLCLGQSPPPKESLQHNNNNSSSACHDNNSQQRDHCHVRVYCVGDGKYPLTAAAMAVHYPEWECISIDPILEPLPCVTDNKQPSNRPRLVQFSGLSQDYRIPPIPEIKDCDGRGEDGDEFLYLDIVLACHSHAPLQEFWDRIVERHIQRRGPSDSSSSTSADIHRHSALAITMACCANYSDLQQEPALVFEDFEVYSPKREIRIFHAEDVIAQSYCRRVANPSDMAIP